MSLKNKNIFNRRETAPVKPTVADHVRASIPEVAPPSGENENQLTGKLGFFLFVFRYYDTIKIEKYLILFKFWLNYLFSAFLHFYFEIIIVIYYYRCLKLHLIGYLKMLTTKCCNFIFMDTIYEI